MEQFLKANSHCNERCWPMATDTFSFVGSVLSPSDIHDWTYWICLCTVIWLTVGICRSLLVQYELTFRQSSFCYFTKKINPKPIQWLIKYNDLSIILISEWAIYFQHTDNSWVLYNVEKWCRSHKISFVWSAHFYVRIRFRRGVRNRPSWLCFGVESDHTIHTETQSRTIKIPMRLGCYIRRHLFLIIIKK